MKTLVIIGLLVAGGYLFLYYVNAANAAKAHAATNAGLDGMGGAIQTVIKYA